MMAYRDGSTALDFDGSLASEPRRGFAPVIGLSVAAAGSLALWAVLAVALRWMANTLL